MQGSAGVPVIQDSVQDMGILYSFSSIYAFSMIDEAEEKVFMCLALTQYLRKDLVRTSFSKLLLCFGARASSQLPR